MSIQIDWEPGNDRFPRLHWVLDDKAIKAFSHFGVIHELTEGEPVFQHDKPSHALYLVINGEVVISRSGNEIMRATPNHSFGEMGLILNTPRSADAHAAVDSRVLELSREDLGRMMEEDPIWAARLYRVLAECLAEYLHKAAEKQEELE